MRQTAGAAAAVADATTMSGYLWGWSHLDSPPLVRVVDVDAHQPVAVVLVVALFLPVVTVIKTTTTAAAAAQVREEVVSMTLLHIIIMAAGAVVVVVEGYSNVADRHRHHRHPDEDEEEAPPLPQERHPTTITPLLLPSPGRPTRCTLAG